MKLHPRDHHVATPTAPPRDALQRALRAALASHRPDVLHDLLQCHGPATFAFALAGSSARAMADALSLLTPPQRAAVYRHLPGAARRQIAPWVHADGHSATRRPLGATLARWWRHLRRRQRALTVR